LILSPHSLHSDTIHAPISFPSIHNYQKNQPAASNAECSLMVMEHAPVATPKHLQPIINIFELTQQLSTVAPHRGMVIEQYRKCACTKWSIHHHFCVALVTAASPYCN
jgi:hypothetical protein